mgnify:CR=1 FL=1
MNPLLLLGLGLTIVLGGILWLRLHPFLSLILGAFTVGGLTSIDNIEKSMAAKKLTQLWPHRNKLQQFDPSLTRQVYQLARKNYQLHDQAKDRELDDWLKSHLNNPLGENSNGA